MDRKSFLIIAIATLITVIAWVIFDVLHARAQVEIPSQTQELIQPINPNLDQEAIDLLSEQSSLHEQSSLLDQDLSVLS